MKTRIREKFKTLFGVEGEVFASAGRVNLIGEHTDYNGGYVFPGAIDCGIMAEIKVNGTNKVKAFSLDYDEYVEFGLAEEDKPQQQWARYIFGVCRETIKRGGKVEGFNCVFAGDVPLGAGLSSSAAEHRTQLLRCQVRYHGPVRLDLRKERQLDPPELQDIGIQVLPLQSSRLQGGSR